MRCGAAVPATCGCSCNGVDHGCQGLHTRFQRPNIGLRFGGGPFPHLVWVMQAVFPWRQGMPDGDWIASVKFSLPERLLVLT